MTACPSSQYKISLQKPVGWNVKKSLVKDPTGTPIGSAFIYIAGSFDTLPTPINLNRWRYKADSKYSLCSSPHSTTLHILNPCPSALSQGRYTWRHDSCLHQILDFISLRLFSSDHLYGDIDKYRAIENPVTTIPLDILRPFHTRPKNRIQCASNAHSSRSHLIRFWAMRI